MNEAATTDARRAGPGGASASRPTAPRAADDKPFIRISHITKTFSGFVAVDDLSLDVRRGEIFCLLGGSGSGKSTLLRMLAGFETPDRGTIEIDGQDMTGVPPWDRPINMMFQSYALFPHMTVEKNVEYGLRQDRVPKAERAERVAKMLDLVKLGPFAHRKPNQLSGGQRQRVALARALVKRPKALLLDEPLSALDKKLREETQYELQDIQDKLGTTFIVVTHDQEEAMTLGDRIGVMDAGKLIQVDAPRDLYEYPRSRFIANFVGSVNMIEGQVIEDEADHVVLDSPALGGRVFIHHGLSCQLGQTMWVAVRPEKMRVSRERPEAGVDIPAEGFRAEGFNMAEGVVEDISYLGNVTHFRIRLASGITVRVTQANVDRQTGGLTWEDRVWIHWPAEAGVALTS